jgi:HSP20 family protein
VVKAEIPGIEPQDISVSLENQMLTIKGEKKHEKEEKEALVLPHGALLWRLRPHGAAACGSGWQQGDGRLQNGLLTVALPKAPEAKGSTIPVKAE